MLERIRLKLIRVFQSGSLGPIRVYKRARPSDAPKPILDPEQRHQDHQADLADQADLARLAEQADQANEANEANEAAVAVAVADSASPAAEDGDMLAPAPQDAGGSEGSEEEAVPAHAEKPAE